MPRVAALWRHPVKGVGAEALNAVPLRAGRPFPLDRAFAILEAGIAPEDGWMKCRNFIRGAKGASLMAITATTVETGFRFEHPNLPPITVNLPEDGPALIEWLTAIYPKDRPAPATLIQAPETGMADMPYASVSVLNTASLAELSQVAGAPLDQRRFRGNLWLDDLPAWSEYDLIGKTLEIGEARLKIVERNTRCAATRANPDTGITDIDTLRAMKNLRGDIDFGVYAQVEIGGHVALGDKVTIR